MFKEEEKKNHTLLSLAESGNLLLCLAERKNSPLCLAEKPTTLSCWKGKPTILFCWKEKSTRPTLSCWKGKPSTRFYRKEKTHYSVLLKGKPTTLSCWKDKNNTILFCWMENPQVCVDERTPPPTHTHMHSRGEERGGGEGGERVSGGANHFLQIRGSNISCGLAC